MENKTGKNKWTKKFKALIITLSLAFAVALGGACAAIGLSLSDNNQRLGGSLAGGAADSAEINVNIGKTVEVSSADMWADVISASSSANSYVEAKLTQNITAKSGSFGTAENAYNAGALNVPTGKYIVLDLNGYTINRGLTTATAGGSVIINSGNLIITDGSASGKGKITGGNTTSSGGGINTTNGSLGIYGGTISGNKAATGAGMFINNSSLTIGGNAVISNNTATGSGGGIYVYADCNVTMDGGAIKGNTATSSGGGAYINEGAIFTINDGSVSNNTSGSKGGGLATYSTTSDKVCTLNINGGSINGNKATDSGGAVNCGNNSIVNITAGKISNNTTNGNGGGINSSAAGEKNADGTVKTYGLTISGGEISNNTATGNGGGVYAGENATLEMSGGTIEGNYAKNGSGADNTAFGRGGGIYAYKCDVSISDTAKIKNNKADQAGGGMTVHSVNGTYSFEISGGEISGNTSVGGAGGIYITNGTVGTIDNVNISNNTAGLNGGGIYVNTNSTLTMEGGTVSGNTATENGGGVYVATNGTFTMNGGTIDGNISTADFSDPLNGGGGVYAASGSTFAMYGGTVSNNHTDGRGGGIFLGENTEAKKYIISQGEGKTILFEGNSAYSWGGGIHLSRGVVYLDMTGGTINDNASETGGGGVCIPNGSVVTFNNVNITNNSALITANSEGTGGGIDTRGTTTLTDCTISGNTATKNGGGIFARNTLTVLRTSFTKNSAERGGGIYVDGGTCTLGGDDGSCKIGANMDDTEPVAELGNTAYEGGGIYVAGGTFKLIGSSRVWSNSATNGGGIYLGGGSAMLQSVMITNNTALNDGGGVYHNGTLTVSRTCTINENTSGNLTNNLYITKNGAAIRTFNSSASFATASRIGISSEIPGTFYTNSAGHVTTDDYFFADNSDLYSITKSSTNFNITLKTQSQTLAQRWANAVNNSSTGNPQLFELTANWTATTSGSTTKFDTTSLSATTENDFTKPFSYYGSLVVPANANVILDLNGYTLDRALKSTQNGGHVIVVYGTLTIKGNGTIKGGNAGEGGGILVNGGTLIFNGGTISGNTANNSSGVGGSGVSIQGSGGKFIMNGGTISGNTAAGSGNGGGVYAYSGTTFTMNGGTISGNTASQSSGGVAVNGGTFTMNGGTISGNTVGAYYGGAGICAFSKATVNINGGTISGHTSVWGSGINLSSNSTLNIGKNENGVLSGNAVISNNTATSTGSAQGGGGIFIGTDCTMNMYSGTISDNESKSGGGIYIDGDSTTKKGGTLNMEGGTISGNTATSNGGGICANAYSTIEISGGKISNNEATGSGETGKGGGIISYTTLNISGNTEISGNTANVSGGGVFATANLTISGGKISGNTAVRSGGGIYSSSSLTINGGNIDGNYATGTANPGGGGLYASSATVNMNGGSISNNVGEGGAGLYLINTTFNMYGGVIAGNKSHISGNTANNGGLGGAVALVGVSTFTMDSKTVDGQTTYGIIENNTAAAGGGFYLCKSLDTQNNQKLIIKAGIIRNNSVTSNGGGIYLTDNSTLTMDGGEISGNTSSSDGGGVYQNAGTFTMNDGVIANNKSTVAGGGVMLKGEMEFTGGTIYNNTATENGGGVYIATSGKLTMSADAKIEGNTAVDGGGVCINALSSAIGKLYINGGVISNNTATGNGGGVSSSGTLEMTAGEIAGNTAANTGGGGVYSTGTFTMSGGEISDNTAISGGGVCVANTFNMSGGTISDNSGTTGGGVFIGSGAVFTMSQTAAIKNNEATNGGGVCVNLASSNKGTFNMNGGTISGNTATGNGGGVYDRGTFTMTNGEISGNKAATGGGGIFLTETGVATVSDGVIKGNRASVGGGVYIDRTTFTMTGGTVTENIAGNGGIAQDGTFNVSGSPVITGNMTSAGIIRNVFLPSTNTRIITVNGALTANARIGVTAESNALRTVTAGYGGKTGHTADFARVVFFADAEGVIANTTGTGTSMQVTLVEGKMLTVMASDGTTELGKMATVAGATVKGVFNKNTRVYTLTEYSGATATANVLNVTFTEDILPAGYAAYMYASPASTDEISEITVSADRSVYIGTKAIEVSYKIKYNVELATGGYSEFEVSKSGITGTPVSATGFATDLIGQVANLDQYEISGTAPTTPIAGNGSTVVNVTLKLKRYTVRFTFNGTQVLATKEYGYGTAIKQDTAYTGSGAEYKIEGVNNPTRDMNTFHGWYTDMALTQPLDIVGAGTVVLSDMTIYAKFVAEEWHITFNMNIGEGENQIDTYNVLASKPANLVGKDNMNGGKVSWNYEGLFNATFLFDTSNDDLGKYGITYTVNNVSRSGLSLNRYQPSAIGYTFNGWINAATGNAYSVISQPRANATEAAKNVELVAQWTPTVYNIRLNLNRGDNTADDILEATNLTLWQDILSEVTTPTRSDGYVFKGWYRTLADANAAADDSSIRDIYSWASIKDYDDESGWAQTAAFSIYDFGDDEVEAGLFTVYGSAEEGYNFNNLTLYAAWESIDVVIRTANIQNGSLSFNRITGNTVGNVVEAGVTKVRIGATILVTATPAAGYDLKNITVNLANGRTRNITSNANDAANTRRLTINASDLKTDGNGNLYVEVNAAFEEHSYRITYRLDGGTVERGASYVSSYTVSRVTAADNRPIGEKAQLPDKVTKLGYTFTGWNFVTMVNGEEVDTGTPAFHYNDDGEMWLVSPLTPLHITNYANVTVKAQWEAQTSTVYLYNASYSLLDDDRTATYVEDTTNNRYSVSRIVSGDNELPIVTGMTIEIVNPKRTSFTFLGWSTTSGGVVAYPVEYDDDGNITGTIHYAVNADKDASGAELDRNKLYAIWQVAGVEYINITANNNGTTYGEDGITMTASPAQQYTAGTGETIRLTYTWYRIFAGQYDNCFVEKAFTDKNGYYVYVNANGTPVAYEKDNKWYDVESDGTVDRDVEITQEQAEARGTKLTYKEFNPSAVGVSCEQMFRTPSTTATQDTVKVVNVDDCGTYICVVNVVASVGDSSTSRAGGYGEIEITMNKATFGGLTFEDESVQYDSTSQAGSILLGVSGGAIYDPETGYLTLPDNKDIKGNDRTGSRLIVSYTYYKVDGNNRVKITDLSQIKNAGTYIVVVSFEFLSDGDNGNYELIEPISAELVITPYTIGSIGATFMHNGESAGAQPYTGKYDGEAYSVELAINDIITTSDLKVAEDGVQLVTEVYKEASGSWTLIGAGEQTVDAGNYYIEITGLTGSGAANYVLGSANTLRYSYTIGKSKFELNYEWEEEDTVTFDNKIHTLGIKAGTLPDEISVTYKETHILEDSTFDPSAQHFVANGGRYAGTYQITATLAFKNKDMAKNYEALPAPTNTLRIEKADLIEYYRSVYSEDVLAGGNFVNATYAFATTVNGEAFTGYHPYVESGSLANTTNFALTYEYYKVNPNGGGREIIASGKHADLVNQENLIFEAGTYQIVVRVEFLQPLHRNNLEELDEEQATITYVIEEIDVLNVVVNWKSDTSVWASKKAMTVYLGDSFDYNWIDNIVVTYEGNQTRTISGSAVNYAVVTLESGDAARREESRIATNFWHVGEFDVAVTYYGFEPAPVDTFTVIQVIDSATVQYSEAGSGFKDVPEGGLVYREENDYIFRIAFGGTDESGNENSSLTTPAVVKNGTLVLGANELTATAEENEVLYYEFGDLYVNIYKEATDITWMYREVGSGDSGWKAIDEENPHIKYAGVEFEVQAWFKSEGSEVFDYKLDADTNGAVLRNYNNGQSYRLTVGASEDGKYRVGADYILWIDQRELTLSWDTSSKVYNGGRSLSPAASGDITAADAELVTFKYSFATASGTKVDNMTNVGNYKVTAQLDGDSELIANYVIVENAEYDFAITPADIDMTATYNESTYGANRTYEGNGELRVNALQGNFAGATLQGTYKFVVYNSETQKYDDIDGVALAERIFEEKIPEGQTSKTVTINYSFKPNSTNYKEKIGEIVLTVLKQTARTGAGSLSLELGENATKVYLKSQSFNTNDIIVYRLYQSAYYEGGRWYGKREPLEPGSTSLTIGVLNLPANGYVITEADLNEGKIMLKASIGSSSGTLDIPVTDKIPTAIYVTSGIDFKKEYYVGEEYDFSDIDFTVVFDGEAQSGFKYGSITSDVSKFTNSNGEFAFAGTHTVTFTYINKSCEVNFVVNEKDTLTVELPNNRRTLVWTGLVLDAPQLTFTLNGKQITPAGVTYSVVAHDRNGREVTLVNEGEYELVYTFNVTNPAYNDIDNFSVWVTVTKNPYSATVTLPTELTKVYTGNSIPIPKPVIGDVIDASNGNSKVTNYTVIYTINGEVVTLSSSMWSQVNRGRYVVTITIRIGEYDAVLSSNDSYTFEILQAENTATIDVPEFVVLGKTEFNFNVKAKFDVTYGATITVEYRHEGGNWSTEVPDISGKWYVRVTVQDGSQYGNFAQITIEQDFEVRSPDASASVGNGSIEGGNGISDDWTLEITQMEAEAVGQVSINRQNVLDGYNVVLKNGNEIVTGEGEYTVRVKLSEELGGRGDLKVFFMDANGKTSSRSARVEDGYIVFKTSDFGSFIITSEIPEAKSPVGLIAAVVILGVVAAAGVAACIIVFLKKKKRGAN